MKDNKYVVFDFDGTIAETIEFAVELFNKIASEFNLSAIKEKELELIKSRNPKELLKIFGVNKLKLTLIMLRLRKEMSYSIKQLDLVKGMADSLADIKAAGYRLGILTSNSTNNVKEFLEAHHLVDAFDFIYSGKNLFGKKKVIKQMLKTEKISKKNIVYVGDEIRDVEASKKSGIPVISVSWGLNDKNILASSQPNKLIDKPEELLPSVVQIYE